MAVVKIDALESRRLMANSGDSAAVAEDLLVIHADLQQIHVDRIQLHTVARNDQNNARRITSADRAHISKDLLQLHIDQRNDSLAVITDLKQLKADGQTLAADLRQTAITGRSDRALVVIQLNADEATLRSDLTQLRVDRHAKG